MGIPFETGPHSDWREEHPELTTEARVALLRTIQPLLAVLVGIADAQTRHADRQVPPATRTAARRVLRDCRRILAQEAIARGLLVLPDRYCWADLRIVLGLARAGLQQFTEAYRYFDDRDSDFAWATLERAGNERAREIHFIQNNAARVARGLPELPWNTEEEDEDA